MTRRSVWTALVALSLSTSLSLAVSDVVHPHDTLTKMAFGSCHKRKYVNISTEATTIWDTIQQHDQPDAFVWTGDSIYPPTRGIASLELLEEEYHHMKHNESLGYSSFEPPMGIYGTYDDHDFGGNDLGEEMPQKPERAAAFLNFLNQQVSTDDERHGIYHSVEWGEAPRKVKLILLDTRWHRQDHCIPSVAHLVPLGAAISCITRWLTAGLLLPDYIPKCRKPRTIIGQEQWTWLEEQVQNSSAQVNVVVSSIQVLTTNPVMESWGHYPEERARLFKLLNGVSGTVLLSGDVHHAEIASPLPNDNNKSTFVEVTSSGMTHTCATPIYGYYLCKPLLETFHAHRFREKDNFYIGKNYGTLEVDWEKDSFQVLVHDETGEVVLSTGSLPFERDVLSEEELNAIQGVNDGHLIPKARKLLTILLALVVACLVHVVCFRAAKRDKNK